MSGLEDRLQGALSKADREGEERARLDSELQATKQESKLRKKMLATQQLLLQASFNNYHKVNVIFGPFLLLPSGWTIK